MSIPAILIATTCYIVTAYSSFMRKDYPMTLVWASYSCANLGFVWYELKK